LVELYGKTTREKLFVNIKANRGERAAHKGRGGRSLVKKKGENKEKVGREGLEESILKRQPINAVHQQSVKRKKHWGANGSSKKGKL